MGVVVPTLLVVYHMIADWYDVATLPFPGDNERSTPKEDESYGAQHSKVLGICEGDT